MARPWPPILQAGPCNELNHVLVPGKRASIPRLYCRLLKSAGAGGKVPAVLVSSPRPSAGAGAAALRELLQLDGGACARVTCQVLAAPNVSDSLLAGRSLPITTSLLINLLSGIPGLRSQGRVAPATVRPGGAPSLTRQLSQAHGPAREGGQLVTR